MQVFKSRAQVFFNASLQNVRKTLVESKRLPLSNLPFKHVPVSRVFYWASVALKNHRGDTRFRLPTRSMILSFFEARVSLHCLRLKCPSLTLRVLRPRVARTPGAQGIPRARRSKARPHCLEQASAMLIIVYFKSQKSRGFAKMTVFFWTLKKCALNKSNLQDCKCKAYSCECDGEPEVNFPARAASGL